MQDKLIIRSRAILPIERPPIFNGALVMQGDKILAVDDWAKVRREFVGTVLDLDRVQFPQIPASLLPSHRLPVFYLPASPMHH